MNTTTLKNGKYYHGRFDAFEKTRGWFVGSFFEEGHPCKTEHVEIAFAKHNKGSIVGPHYHKLKVELIIVLKGKVKYKVNDQEVTLNKGDFLFADVNNILSADFLESSEIFAIHSPSIPTDKVVVNGEEL
jgi:quercetin dioxygenase-like cupin family protein